MSKLAEIQARGASAQLWDWEPEGSMVLRLHCDGSAPVFYGEHYPATNEHGEFHTVGIKLNGHELAIFADESTLNGLETAIANARLASWINREAELDPPKHAELIQDRADDIERDMERDAERAKR